MAPKQIFYFTECGCIVTREGTRRKKGYRRVCIEHGKAILRAERECADCNIILDLEHTGKGPYRCEKHEAENRKAVKHRAYAKAALRVSKREIVPVKKIKNYGRGDYCVWLKSCIREGSLSCQKCLKFSGIFKNHDPRKMEQFTVR